MLRLMRLVAAEESHFEGRSDLALVLSLIDELTRQRRAFMADVRTYNLDIAEYAMSAPTPPLDPQGLASMLIKPMTGGGGTARYDRRRCDEWSLRSQCNRTGRLHATARCRNSRPCNRCPRGN